MAYFQCPDCGKKHEIFGPSRVESTARIHDIPNVAKIPIDPLLAADCDDGRIEIFDGDWLDGLADAIEKL